MLAPRTETNSCVSTKDRDKSVYFLSRPSVSPHTTGEDTNATFLSFKFFLFFPCPLCPVPSARVACGVRDWENNKYLFGKVLGLTSPVKSFSGHRCNTLLLRKSEVTVAFKTYSSVRASSCFGLGFVTGDSIPELK